MNDTEESGFNPNEFAFTTVPCLLLLRPASEPTPDDVFQIPTPDGSPGKVLLLFSDHDLATRLLRNLNAENRMTVGQFDTAEKLVQLLTAARDGGTTHVGIDFIGQPGGIAIALAGWPCASAEDFGAVAAW